MNFTPPTPPSSAASRFAARFAALPSPLLFALFFAAVALSHLTLLHLPYFWDEAGYYIPAALDFYHYSALIPQFSNAHPPLPNVVLGTLWHITGYHVLTTRLTVCAFAAGALLAVFRLTQRLLGPAAAIATTFLTAVYPIWFAQSTLAHADIFAAAFTLAAFALYLPSLNLSSRPQPRLAAAQNLSSRPQPALAAAQNLSSRPQRSAVERPLYLSFARCAAIAALFSLAAISKETAIIEPAILAAIHLTLLFVHRRDAALRSLHKTWLATLSIPLLPLLAWYAYHHHKAGSVFGNRTYLRYNATANFNAAHIVTSFYYRGIHLFWQRNIWLPILLALACLLLPKRTLTPDPQPLTPVFRTIALLLLGNWLVFSVLGGALLTRYLLPMYPLILFVCVAIWCGRTRYWPWLAALTAAAFVSAIWLNPPTSFAPEDNLTYRDMIVVHQEAAAYIDRHYPDAQVLTAWPASSELFVVDLGYVSQTIKVTPLENFTAAEINKAAQEPGKFDTALIFTTHYTSPALQRYLLKHPNTKRGREFAQDRDLTPQEVAAILHGTVIVEYERNGETAAVLRFSRSYEARNIPPLTR